jgi:hypothetical protein
MSEVGELSVRITGDDQGLDQAVKSSERNLRSMADTAAKVATRVATLGVAAAAAGAALATSTVMQAAASADEMAKLSQRTGVAIEDLGRLAHAADMSGVSQGELTSSLTRLSRSMQDAVTGSGRSADAFARLGIATQNTDGSLRAQADVMSDIADRFSRMEDGATKTALAQDIFGRSGATLIPMLNAGARGLQQMGDEAQRLGIVFDAEAGAAAEQFNDNLSRLQKEAIGAGRQFAGPVIGALLSFTNRLVEARSRSAELSVELAKVRGIDEHRTAFQRLGDAIAGVIGRMTGLINLSDSERLGQLTEQLAKQEAALNRLTEGESRSAGMRLRNIAAARQEIEETKVEIDLINQRIAAREREAQLMLQPPEPFVPAAPGVPDPEDVGERLNQVNEIIATNHEATLQRLREFGMSESELEMERHQQRIDQLAQALFDEAITHEDQYALLEQLEEEHANRMTRIAQREAQNRANIEQRVQRDITNMRNAAFSAGVGLLQSFGSESKVAALAAIALNKGLMLAQTIQNTAAAQMRALAELGPIAGPPAAAKIGMYGKIQAGIIAATGLMQAAAVGGGNAAMASSGSMTPVASGGGMATSSGSMTPVMMDRPRMPTTATINIVGESFTRSQVAQLIDAINDLTADGARLVIA